MSGKKKLFASFITDEMLRESGRLPYLLLYPFLVAGFEVRVYDNLRHRLTEFYKCDESGLPKPARLTLSMPDAKFADGIPEDSGDWIYLFDHPLDSAKRRPWRKLVHVRFDLFSPYRLRAPVIAPYSMNPCQTEWALPENLERLRRVPRGLRVFFAGDSTGYVRNRVRYPGPKLPRLEVLTTLKERIPEDIVTVSGAEDIARLCASGFAQKFVLSDSGSGIAPSQWLPTVATADVFLCPPGMVMPMCHNVVEAMAVGTIPLISYPEWLHPNLKHLTNCIVFDGKDDLVEKMRLVLGMPAPQVVQMRANVVDYYESHLRPDVVVRALETRPESAVTLLLYTELNMATNSSKLNRNSIIIKGPEADGPLRWIGKTIDRHVGGSACR